MDITTQLPSLTEKQLSTMLGNAERLGLAGNKKQKIEATRLPAADPGGDRRAQGACARQG
jgi:hypothetical protein